MPGTRTALAALALSLAACTSVAPGPAAGSAAGARGGIADGSSFALAPGQSATLSNGGTLRYERLVNDSRCPPDVQCVWAGDAEVAFSWRGADGGRDAFSLHTGRGDKSHVVGGLTVTLVALARGTAPEATLRVDAGG